MIMKPPQPKLSATDVFVLAVCALVLLLLPLLVRGDDEAVRVRVSAAKTIAALESQPELPDAPPNVVLNLKGEAGGIRQGSEATRQHDPPRLVTIFTAEEAYGERWCPNCPGLIKKLVPGDERVTVVVSTKRAPGEQSYPAVRCQNSKGVWQQPTVDGKVVVLDSLDELVRWVDAIAAREAASWTGTPSKGGVPRLGGPVVIGDAVTLGQSVRPNAELVSVAGVAVKPWYESVNGQAVQPTDEHLRHHGFMAEQIARMRFEDRCFWHGLAHQLEGRSK